MCWCGVRKKLASIFALCCKAGTDSITHTHTHTHTVERLTRVPFFDALWVRLHLTTHLCVFVYDKSRCLLSKRFINYSTGFSPDLVVADVVFFGDRQQKASDQRQVSWMTIVQFKDEIQEHTGHSSPAFLFFLFCFYQNIHTSILTHVFPLKSATNNLNCLDRVIPVPRLMRVVLYCWTLHHWPVMRSENHSDCTSADHKAMSCVAWTRQWSDDSDSWLEC